MWSNDLRAGLGAKRKWGKEAAQKNNFSEQDVWSCCSPNFLVFSFGFQYILESHSADSFGMFTNYKITWLTMILIRQNCISAGHFIVVTWRKAKCSCVSWQSTHLGHEVVFVATLQNPVLARQLSSVITETFWSTSGYLERFTRISESENSDVFLLSIISLKVSESMGSRERRHSCIQISKNNFRQKTLFSLQVLFK